MTLTELLTQLSLGVFSNLSLGNDGAGTIKADKIPMVVSHINEGLLRIFTRLVLSEKSLIIEMGEVRTRYPLLVKHATSDATPGVDKFIIDTAEHPYIGDIIKILVVHNGLGCELPLNNPTACTSLFTPRDTVLEVPNPVAGHALAVTYQAKHPKLSFSSDPEAMVCLPENLHGALIAYVAYKVYGNMNTQEALMNSQKYQLQYNEIVAEVLEMDTVNMTYSQTNTKFHQNGYV